MVKVSLYIYDLSKGMASQLSLPLLGKKIDGIWHTSIVVFDKEYFFGGDGISDCTPCGTILGPPDETIILGETTISKNVFHEYLTGLSQKTFSSEKYHLFNHNCNTFSNEVSQFLTGKKIPSYITNLPLEVMSTPFGAMIGQFFENVRVQPQISDNFHEFGGLSSSSSETNLDHYIGSDRPAISEINMSATNETFSHTEIKHKLKIYEDNTEFVQCLNHLKLNFENCSATLDKLRDVVDGIDFGFEETTRKEITVTLSSLCKEMRSEENEFVESFKSLLVVLRSCAIVIPKLFKYAEGDEVILQVVNKLQRGNFTEIKLLRLQFITNLLSVYELRNHLLAINSLLRTIVNLVVSSILDGPGVKIKEAGCCLAYSLSIVKINEDHTFEISSALLHVIADLTESTEARKYCIEALKCFMKKSDQVSELASMIVPSIYELELR
ncbi:uncharacterized protein LOC100207210 isoform X1 [Hydra vulgaris]|uniref:uncharacterized protein LOC100207210 isoform X1 n=1 Tax=Hydra vulgaris TaxID=6087 RepID=UPI001F5E7227|nr:uncharacterized protein LOC100207210 [Hydra vulgaris]XP_047143257.1 uncharacterized protein LOC100207210 [Hydra vulgaris]XP_047143258.1 uncharacterized protein LOC100207210 [Hydra vulgaris]